MPRLNRLDLSYKPEHVEALMDEIGGLEIEHESVLRKLALHLAGKKNSNDVAWWLCANHAAFIIEFSNLDVEGTLIQMASAAGDPPKGGTWPEWFARVRDIESNETTDDIRAIVKKAARQVSETK